MQFDPETLIYVAILLAIAGVVFYYAMSDAIKRWNEEDRENEAFERSRRQRQKEFDRHAQAVAKAVLFDTCETIYLGRTNK
jgi:Na+-transporting methylmalonyl-CoA/oxaloacetate decarboxylase gamma subunit